VREREIELKLSIMYSLKKEIYEMKKKKKEEDR